MESPYDAPDSLVTAKRSGFMRRLAGWACVVTSLLATLILVLNFAGCCLYFYVNIGSKDLVFGGAIGVSHTAITPHQEMAALENDPLMQSLGTIPGYWHTDLVKLGPFHLFAEPPGESFQPFRFDFVSDAEYTAIEFPLLLLVAAFGSLGWLLMRRRRVT